MLLIRRFEDIHSSNYAQAKKTKTLIGGLKHSLKKQKLSPQPTESRSALDN